MKKKNLKLFGAVLLVVLVGLGGYLFLSSEQEVEVETEPPTLEEDVSLQGSLVASSRFFNILNSADKTAAGVVTEETDSNFLIFGTDNNFSTNATVEEFVENLLVSDGAEGFLFGKFEGNRWKLFPNAAYLSSSQMESSDLNACSTYFVVKLAHDPAISQPKSSFTYDIEYLKSISQDVENCTSADRNLVANGWNLVSGDFGSKDAFISYVNDVAEIDEVYDTYIINQTDTQKALLTNGRNEASQLVFSKSKGIDELDAYFKSDKQNMWLKLGNSNSSVPVIKTTSITIDADTVTDGGVVGKLIVDGSDQPFVYETVGTSNFEIDNNGDVRVGRVDRLQLDNKSEFKVSEQANSNDFDQEVVTLKLDLDLDKCSQINAKVADNIVYLTNLVSNFDPNDPPEIVGLINDSESDLANVCSKFNIAEDNTQSLAEIATLKQTLDGLIVEAPEVVIDSDEIVRPVLNQCLTESLYGKGYWYADNPPFPENSTNVLGLSDLINVQPFPKFESRASTFVNPELVVEFDTAEFCIDKLKIETVNGLEQFQIGQFYQVSTDTVELNQINGFDPIYWDSNQVFVYANYLEGQLVLTLSLRGNYSTVLGQFGGTTDLTLGKGLFVYEDVTPNSAEFVKLEGANFVK